MAYRRPTRIRGLGPRRDRAPAALVALAHARALALALPLAFGLTSCGSAHRSPTTAATNATTTGRAHTIPATAHRPSRHHPHRRPAPRHPAPNPGTLAQTSRLPHSDGPFHAEMRALWRGITANSTHAALSAFFPEAAYAQVKAIADPAADFNGRLVGDYSLDIAAAHALLGAGARSARLVAVNVPSGYAHWVPPNACYNRVGYYEVADARLVYREGGELRSFGIASLISWRGRWYVVHLGAVVRTAASGIVEDPETGPGASAPSSTC